MSGHSHTHHYGPLAPTRLDLMGIRYMVPPNDDGSGAGAFEPINTQDEFNSRIQERIARAEKPYEPLKGLDVTQVIERYNAVKDLDVAALQAQAAELATLKSSRGADQNELTQKITDAETRATTAETKVTDAERTIGSLQGQLDRYEAAAAAGIPLTHAPRLVGSTKEELEADAKAFKSTLRIGGYDPGQGHQDGGAPEGAQGIAEAKKRFG